LLLRWLDQARRTERGSPPVVLSFLCHLVLRVAEAIRVHRMGAVAKDAELVVLRPPARRDPAAGVSSPLHLVGSGTGQCMAGLVTRDRWASFLVTPETILRWNRALVRRRWTSPPAGRSPDLAPGDRRPDRAPSTGEPVLPVPVGVLAVGHLCLRAARTRDRPQ
jgi:hypothetical protein